MRSQINKEAWAKEADYRHEQINQLLQRVKRRDEEALIPYMRLLDSLNYLDQPHPELAWLQPKVEDLRTKILEPYHDYFFAGSLLGPRDYKAKDRDDLHKVMSNIERAVRSFPRILEGKPQFGGQPRLWVEVINDILDYHSRLPKIYDALKIAIEEALAERDAHPEAQDFAYDYKDELREIRHYLKELKRVEAIHGAILRESIEPQFGEEGAEYLTAEHEAAEALSQAWNSFDYLGDELRAHLEHLLNKGYPDPARGSLSDDGQLQAQWGQMTSKMAEAVHWIRSQPGKREKIEQILQENPMPPY